MLPLQGSRACITQLPKENKPFKKLVSPAVADSHYIAGHRIIPKPPEKKQEKKSQEAAEEAAQVNIIIQEEQQQSAFALTSAHSFPPIHQSNSPPRLPPHPPTNEPLIKFKGLINGHQAVMLLDSGASGNFICSSFIDQHKLSTSSAKRIQSVTLADGSKQSSSAELSQAQVCIEKFHTHLNFAVLPLTSSFDAILGMSFLRRHNPSINWNTRIMSIKEHEGEMHLLRSQELNAVMQTKVVSRSCNSSQPQTNCPTSASRVVTARKR